MRAHTGGDRRYDAEHARDDGERESIGIDGGRHDVRHTYPHDRYTLNNRQTASALHGHAAAASALSVATTTSTSDGAPTAPGSTSQSPHNPGSYPYTHATGTSGPGSAMSIASDQSPHNPGSYPYSHATPPQPQGYRPYLSSPTDASNGSGPSGPNTVESDGRRNRPRRDSDVSMATTSTKRAQDTPGSDLQPTPGSVYTDRSRQPWEEAYRQSQSQVQSQVQSQAQSLAQTPNQSQTQPQDQDQDQDSGNQPAGSASQSRNTKPPDTEPPTKKRRRAKAAPTQDIPDGAEVEYEDPGGDRSRGPVFVHPPKGSVQACIRCHRIKRKCDGAWPRCASCARVDVPCVFELSAATSSYVHKLKKANDDLAADLRASEARIQDLETRMHALELQLAGGGGGGDKPPGEASGNGNAMEFSRLAAAAAGAMRDHAAHAHAAARDHHALSFLAGVTPEQQAAAAASVGVGVGVGGGAYPPLGGFNGPYGPYAPYAASYPGPYGEYGEGFDESWAEHWRPEGEGWWGHLQGQ